jgi:hypothetical protein
MPRDRPAERLAREHRLVADRDAMLVHALLESPEPVRLRAEDGGGLLDLRELEILAADPRPACVPARGSWTTRWHSRGGRSLFFANSATPSRVGVR